MDLRLYELTFVLEPQLNQEKIEEFVGKIESIITEEQGTIEKKDLWGKRRLAYEINKKQYGFYVYLLFRAPGSVVAKIERELKLSESVLRFLTVRVSKKALKQMQKDNVYPIEKAAATEDVSASEAEEKQDQ